MCKLSSESGVRAFRYRTTPSKKAPCNLISHRRERRRGGGDLVVQRRLGRRLGNGRPGRRRRERRRAGEEERARDGLHRRLFDTCGGGRVGDPSPRRVLGVAILSSARPCAPSTCAVISGFRGRRARIAVEACVERRPRERAGGRAQRAGCTGTFTPAAPRAVQRASLGKQAAYLATSRDARPRFFAHGSIRNSTTPTDTNIERNK